MWDQRASAISYAQASCQPYLHESRHKHAMRRPRGPGGRFLTSEEIAAQKATLILETGPSASPSQDGDDDEGENALGEDVDMALTSPTEQRMKALAPASPQVDQATPNSNSIVQQSLQPRPQVQIPTQSQQSQLLTSQAMLPPQSQSQSPFDHSLSMSHSELLTAYHAASHPPTPAPVSPHAPMPDLMQHSQDRLQHNHSGHGHHSHHTHTHDHQRHITSAITHNGGGHTVVPATPAISTPTSSLSMRSSYAPMQMHHVPHPHAHARHHHSYLNRTEQLYASNGQGSVFRFI